MMNKALLDRAASPIPTCWKRQCGSYDGYLRPGFFRETERPDGRILRRTHGHERQDHSQLKPLGKKDVIQNNTIFVLAHV